MLCRGLKLGRSYWWRNVGWGCSENRVLKEIFVPKRDEVTGEWSKLHNEELEWSVLINKYCAGDRIENNEIDGACSTYGVRRFVYRVLVGKREGRSPFGRPRRRWEDKIKMDLQEGGCRGMDWIELAQDRDRWWALVNAGMNLWVPWNAGNFLTSCKPVSFTRRTLHRGVSK